MCIPGNRDGSSSNSRYAYHCDCTATGQRHRKQKDGSESCVTFAVCGRSLRNPCLAGQCVDNKNGYDYTCNCVPGYSLGNNTEGSAVCLPDLATTPTTIVVQDSGATCGTIALGNKLIVSQLQMLNPLLADLCSDNEARIVGGTVVIVGPVAIGTNCAILYTIAKDDTLNTVAALMSSPEDGTNVTVDDLTYLNPDINISSNSTLPLGHLLCVAGGNSALQPVCAYYATVGMNDTCAQIIATNGILPLAFFFLNPGIDCGLIGQYVGLDVCVAPVLSGGALVDCNMLKSKVPYPAYTSKYYTNKYDSCYTLKAYFGCRADLMICYNSIKCDRSIGSGTVITYPTSLAPPRGKMCP